MPTITFLPDQVQADYRPGERVFDVARREGIEVDTSCVGKGTCGLCRVKIVAGEEHLSPFNETETKHLGNVYFLTKVRLSCQAVADGEGDVVVELAPRRRRKRDG